MKKRETGDVLHFRETEARGSSTEDCSVSERLRLSLAPASSHSCQQSRGGTGPPPPALRRGSRSSGLSPPPRGRYPRAAPRSAARRCRSFSGATLTPGGSAGGRGGEPGRETIFPPVCEIVHLSVPARGGCGTAPRGPPAQGRRMEGANLCWGPGRRVKAERTSKLEKNKGRKARSLRHRNTVDVSRKWWSCYRINFLAEHTVSFLEWSSALFSVSFELFPSPHWIEPFLTTYVSHRMDAPVLHRLLFYTRADWVQLSGGEGCSGISLHSHGQQSNKESDPIHFHIEFLERSSLQYPGWPCLTTSCKQYYHTDISTEEAELSPLTASNQGCLMYLLWKGLTDVRAYSQSLPQKPRQVPEHALPSLPRETRVLTMSNSNISSSVRNFPNYFAWCQVVFWRSYLPHWLWKGWEERGKQAEYSCNAPWLSALGG